jgi:hypothetical protein
MTWSGRRVDHAERILYIPRRDISGRARKCTREQRVCGKVGFSMRSGRLSRVSGLIIATALLTGATTVQANTAIPGDLVVQGIQNSSNGLLWLLDAMFICIGIEGAIYAYTGFIRNPIRTSAIANTVSLIAGFPLGLAFAALADAFPGHEGVSLLLLPTLASIGIEGIVVSAQAKPETPHPRLRAWGVVIVANVLTNIILWIYLYMGMRNAGYLGLWAAPFPPMTLRAYG